MFREQSEISFRNLIRTFRKHSQYMFLLAGFMSHSRDNIFIFCSDINMIIAIYKSKSSSHVCQVYLGFSDTAKQANASSLEEQIRTSVLQFLLYVWWISAALRSALSVDDVIMEMVRFDKSRDLTGGSRVVRKEASAESDYIKHQTHFWRIHGSSDTNLNECRCCFW